MLIFAAAEVEQYTKKTLGVGKTTASILGGMGGGIAQAVRFHYSLADQRLQYSNIGN